MVSQERCTPEDVRCMHACILAFLYKKKRKRGKRIEESTEPKRIKIKIISSSPAISVSSLFPLRFPLLFLIPFPLLLVPVPISISIPTPISFICDNILIPRRSPSLPLLPTPMGRRPRTRPRTSGIPLTGCACHHVRRRSGKRSCRLRRRCFGPSEVVKQAF